jgi:hypothetical protein
MTQDSESVGARQKTGFPRLLENWMNGRTRAAAALALGVSWGTIDNWLNGVCQPPVSRVQVLAMLMALPSEQIRAALILASDFDAGSATAAAEPTQAGAEHEDRGGDTCPQPAGTERA